MAYKNMDTMTLAESMREFPWQDYEWMSFRSNGPIHKKRDEHHALCGREAPAFGHNWYDHAPPILLRCGACYRAGAKDLSS